MPKTKANRPRTIQACNSCRSKKYKCDGCMPCSHCRKQARDCVFQGSFNNVMKTDVYSIGYVKELERKLEKAEAAIHTKELSLGNRPVDKNVLEQQKPTPARTDQSHLWEIDQSNQQIPAATKDYQELDLQLSTEQINGIVNEDQDIMNDGSTDEIMDINKSTHRFEFHGQTSPLALLERLRKSHEQSSDYTGGLTLSSSTCTPHIVSDFQNDSFTGDRQSSNKGDEAFEEFYPLYAMVFIDSYFKTLHFVHPILDQQVFLERSHSLWNGASPQPSQSFKAMYFSVLSLGALTRTWTEETINGIGRYEWTRLLFEKAEQSLGIPGTLNNLEAVQAQFLLAVVCQHLLNPNLAYTYLGIAIRTTLSTGMNRNARFRDLAFPSDSPSLVVSRTWWALYSLEIELSFTLGRPDTLGFDAYHNRLPPPITNNEISIIPVMLGLSRIMRNISTSIFLDRVGFSTKLQRAETIELNLEEWVRQLPLDFQSISSSDMPSHIGSLHDPAWLQLQNLVLRIRYLHVKTILFYPFLMREQKVPPGQNSSPSLSKAALKCTDGAISIIQTIHSTYYVHEFYRTWWYNVTYITFGLSILLSVVEREPIALRPNSDSIPYINQALELLGAMSKCKVALKIRDFARGFVNGLLNQSSCSPSAAGPVGQDIQGEHTAGFLGNMGFNEGLMENVVGLGYDVFNFDAGLFNYYPEDGEAWKF